MLSNSTNQSLNGAALYNSRPNPSANAGFSLSETLNPSGVLNMRVHAPLHVSKEKKTRSTDHLVRRGRATSCENRLWLLANALSVYPQNLNLGAILNM